MLQRHRNVSKRRVLMLTCPSNITSSHDMLAITNDMKLGQGNTKHYSAMASLKSRKGHLSTKMPFQQLLFMSHNVILS